MIRQVKKLPITGIEIKSYVFRLFFLQKRAIFVFQLQEKWKDQ